MGTSVSRVGRKGELMKLTFEAVLEEYRRREKC
jgi:hypothetical protein